MRLIDADKLMSDIEHYHLSDGKFQHWVEIQPTIEPERKKGKWMRLSGIDGFVQCRSCGTLWDYSIIDALHFHFCPNCGSHNGGEEG